MGWTIYLKIDKVITESQIDDILTYLPRKFSSPIENSKQPWGWSTGADIAHKTETLICMSGSYGISGHIAEDYAKWFERQLNDLGYSVDVQYRW